MKKIWVTKEFKFEAAHYLPGYDGPCNNLHGHSYKLAVSIAGPVDEKSGMVLDFTKLKQIVEECIISKLDHSCLNISHVPGFPEDNPTAENMVAWMGELLSVRIEYEYGLRLVFVKLWETETSSAMWMPGEPENEKERNIPIHQENDLTLPLKVHSIFESISGEAGFIAQGSWCTFIRLQGCNLECPWCDTKESQNGVSRQIRFSEIMEQVGQQQVIITGGEPLMQRNTLALIRALLAAGKKVQVETNGTYVIPEDPAYDKCGWVADYKAPSTNPKFPFNAFYSPFLMKMPENVMIKFVIDQDDDLVAAFEFINSRLLLPARETPMFIFSGMMQFHKETQVWRNRMAEIITEIQKQFPELLPHIIFSLQMHKLMGVA